MSAASFAEIVVVAAVVVAAAAFDNLARHDSHHLPSASIGPRPIFSRRQWRAPRQFPREWRDKSKSIEPPWANRCILHGSYPATRNSGGRVEWKWFAPDAAIDP